MRNRIYILAVIFLCACDSVQDKAITDFTKSFQGTIEGKDEIVMELHSEANSISGMYVFKGKKPLFKLSGAINNNGSLLVNEYNESGIMTGIFQGQLNNDSIIGEWVKPDGSLAMPFSISATTITVESARDTSGVFPIK